MVSDSGNEDPVITPTILLRAYAAGIFPMAQSAQSRELYWVDPDMRGILPLNSFHIPRSLKKAMRKKPFEIRYSTAFDAVVEGCAEQTDERSTTWINRQVKSLYGALHQNGYAHSVEAWQDGELVGGLYGVTLGAAFFGESMFSRRTNASKIALVHLVHHLRRKDYTLLDTQFTTDHLERFGVIEIPRAEYQERLADALGHQCNFLQGIDPQTGMELPGK